MTKLRSAKVNDVNNFISIKILMLKLIHKYTVMILKDKVKDTLFQVNITHS